MDKNPYAAPRAELKDLGAEERKRPLLVWVIVIFQALGIVGGAYTTLAALSGNPVGGPEAADYTKHLTAVDHGLTLAILAISTFAMVELFRLKRRSLPVLIAAFVLGVAIVAFSLAFRPEYRAMFEVAGYWSLMVGWAFNVAIIGYVWRLHSKEVLRP